MRTTATAISYLIVIIAILLPMGCAQPVADDADAQLEEEGRVSDAASSADPDLKSDQLSLPFSVLEDGDLPAAAARETRRVFTSAESFRQYFGHRARGVDFHEEWVVLYSAGVKSSSGYQASIESIRLSRDGKTLKVVTAIESPGAGCITTLAQTMPYELVKVRVPPPRPSKVRFYTNDTVVACQPSRCAADADCRLVVVACPGCECLALSASEPDPVCPGEPVDCLPFLDLCAEGHAACVAGRCVIADGPACNPDQEWNRHYIAKSPTECQVIDYACSDATIPFANQCGCGCEQASTCPRYFDCMPGAELEPACSDPTLRAACPYTEVVV